MPGDTRSWELWYRRFNSTDEWKGDFCDFIVREDRCLYIVIGDVTGRGIGAARVANRAWTTLHERLPTSDDVSHIIGRLNNDLAQVEGGVFLALVVLELQPDGATRIMNAGNPQALFYSRATHKITAGEKTAMVLGVSPTMTMS